MVALAILMPIVASMGGNAGTQTMTVAVRALATRELGRSNAWRIIRREAASGSSTGWSSPSSWARWPGCGSIAAARRRDRPRDHRDLVFAALGGIFVPLILNRFGVDPAVSSGPFVTSITDIVGFFCLFRYRNSLVSSVSSVQATVVRAC